MGKLTVERVAAIRRRLTLRGDRFDLAAMRDLLAERDEAISALRMVLFERILMEQKVLDALIEAGRDETAMRALAVLGDNDAGIETTGTQKPEG